MMERPYLKHSSQLEISGMTLWRSGAGVWSCVKRRFLRYITYGVIENFLTWSSWWMPQHETASRTIKILGRLLFPFWIMFHLCLHEMRLNKMFHKAGIDYKWLSWIWSQFDKVHKTIKQSSLKTTLIVILWKITRCSAIEIRTQRAERLPIRPCRAPGPAPPVSWQQGLCFYPALVFPNS